jgi:hypothetical protein
MLERNHLQDRLMWFRKDFAGSLKTRLNPSRKCGKKNFVALRAIALLLLICIFVTASLQVCQNVNAVLDPCYSAVQSVMRGKRSTDY